MNICENLKTIFISTKFFHSPFKSVLTETRFWSIDYKFGKHFAASVNILIESFMKLSSLDRVEQIKSVKFIDSVRTISRIGFV